ncbi:MAG: DUF559 domain-containing protein [Xanthomonadaceae bacterium]|nr:DUF559 domain-containing protein [Xanthomonadaceae bacterium]
MQLNNLPELRTFRKQLRSHLTPAEAKLWTLLKGSQLDGRKFRRQHSVGRYILDFYCPSERLAIELDGAAHDSDTAQRHDDERTQFLRHFGINVLRFENKWVLQEPEGVLAVIRGAFGWEQKGTTPPLRGTPPYKGGELSTSPPAKGEYGKAGELITSPPDKGEYGEAGELITSPPAKGEYGEAGRGLLHARAEDVKKVERRLAAADKKTLKNPDKLPDDE